LARVYEEFLQNEQKCWLEFTLPGSDTMLEVRAQLSWQTNHEQYHLMAMRFLSIAPSHRRLIDQYAQNAPVASEAAPFVRAKAAA
jgi:hypothetical protein